MNLTQGRGWGGRGGGGGGGEGEGERDGGRGGRDDCYTYYNRYSRTPLIRPPSESHWCGRIRGMVAREGFRYAALLQQHHTKYGRIRGMVVGEGGRSTGVLLYVQ